MSFEKPVVLAVQVDGQRRHLVWGERLRFLEARAEAAAEHVVRHHQLPPSELPVGGGLVRVDVDQLHDPVAVGARGGNEQVSGDVPGDGHVLRERVRLPCEDVGAVLHEALVLHEPRGPAGGLRGVRRRDGPVAVRYRVGGVGHVAVERARLMGWRRLEREPAPGLEIQPFAGRPPRGPRVPRPPAIVARLEGDSLRLAQLTLVLEEVREPGRQNLLLKVARRGAAEVDLAELLSLGAGPAAVVPRPDYEGVHVRRVVPLEQLVDRERSVEVLLVPPSGHVERRNRDACQIRSGRLTLPEAVVVGMRHEVVPARNGPVQMLGIDVRQGPERQIPLVRVVAVELERLLLLRRLHPRGVLEAVAQPERAVVMKVVAQEHVPGRRLRRGRLERRMRVEHRHHGEPAGVRDAEHPHAAVVAGHVREQPVDRVVRVGALVDRVGDAMVAQRPHHDEAALRGVTPADVLEREDVAVVRQGPVVAAQRVGGVGDAVRRAREDDGQRRVCPLRHEDRGVQLDPVAHRDHDLREVEAGGRVGVLPHERGRAQDQDERDRRSNARQFGARPLHGAERVPPETAFGKWASGRATG